MGNPIAITGSGIICSIGVNKQEVLESLLSEHIGIRPIRYLEREILDFPVGEVQCSNSDLESRLKIETPGKYTRAALFGAVALKEAFSEAKISPSKSVAFISGTTVGGMDVSEKHYLDFLYNHDHDNLINSHDCGACTKAIDEYFGNFGFTTCVSTACSSAANAIIFGANLIKRGIYDIVVAGGTECITKFHMNGFNSLRILDRKPCRPFCKTREGLNLGEGAGYIVMESEDSVRKRGVKPIGYLSGYGNACDAFHQTASSPNGEGAFLAVRKALDMSGISPDEIQYINAHGTGTPNNDESECQAIRRVFGDKIPYMSSTKSFTGHTTSASGGVESVICLIALQNQFIPANLSWKEMFDGGVKPPIHTIHSSIQNVLCNSFGFGGNDSSLLFSLSEFHHE